MTKSRQFLAGFVVLLNAAYAHAARVEVGVEALLAPTVGYEQKNNIQVVLYGTLPNKCYSLDEYQVEKDQLGRTVSVRQWAERETSGLCADESHLPPDWKTPIPFMTEVSVGHLPVGNTTFSFMRTGGGVGSRVVRVSPNTTLSIDSMPYAAVSNVGVADVINGTKEIVVTLTGVLNSSCTQLEDEVKVDHESDVFVLLPTVKAKKEGQCLEVLIPFKKKVNLGLAPAGRYLIHARSMNGKALNRVIMVAR